MYMLIYDMIIFNRTHYKTQLAFDSRHKYIKMDNKTCHLKHLTLLLNARINKI